MNLSELIPRLGHRNWIAVVDAAFPEMVAPGVTTLVGGDLEAVVKAIGACRHLRFDAFIDAELAHLLEEDIEGIEAFRGRLRSILEGVSVTYLPHERIIDMLDEAAQRFQVVVVKTDHCLPYTSLFLRLECGYWDDEAEGRLRDRILEDRNSTMMRSTDEALN